MRKKVIFTAIALILLIAGIFTIWFIPVLRQKNMQRRFEEQMDLGNRYLLEQDYEAAVIAFSKAIEIDPRQADSYQKMAEAYVGLDDYEHAILTLEKGYESTGEQSLNEWKMQLEEELEKRQAFVQMIYEACQNSDEDALFQIIETKEYKQFLQDNQLPIFYPESSGHSIGIYEGGVYWGELEKGIRKGKGSWYVKIGDHAYISDSRSRFTGMWADDYPNGMGEMVYTNWNASPYITAGKEYELITGNYRDGYADGEMTSFSTFSDVEGGYREHTIHYKVNYGVYEIIGTDYDGQAIIADEDGVTITTRNPEKRNVGVPQAKKKLE